MHLLLTFPLSNQNTPVLYRHFTTSEYRTSISKGQYRTERTTPGKKKKILFSTENEVLYPGYSFNWSRINHDHGVWFNQSLFIRCTFRIIPLLTITFLQFWFSDINHTFQEIIFPILEKKSVYSYKSTLLLQRLMCRGLPDQHQSGI